MPVGYYFINTGATSLGDRNPHDIWFRHGCAVTGGPPAYGEKLGQFAPGDVLLMYASGVGGVALGRQDA